MKIRVTSQRYRLLEGIITFVEIAALKGEQTIEKQLRFAQGVTSDFLVANAGKFRTDLWNVRASDPKGEIITFHHIPGGDLILTDADLQEEWVDLTIETAPILRIAVVDKRGNNIAGESVRVAYAAESNYGTYEVVTAQEGDVALWGVADGTYYLQLAQGADSAVVTHISSADEEVWVRLPAHSLE